jgi:type VI secretion system protein ImpF
MARTDTTAHRRIVPSLLDRLTDDEPHHNTEPVQQRTLSEQKFRELLLRDLRWLFNTTALEATEDLSSYPEVAKSILNYGLPQLIGRTSTELEQRNLERHIRDILQRYESRIIPSSVKVRVIKDNEKTSDSALALEIEGAVRAQPAPFHLLLRTEIDLAQRTATVVDKA